MGSFVKRLDMLLLLVFLLGAGLRFYQLDAHPLWVDEIYTGIFAHQENTLREVLEWSFGPPLPRPPLIFLITHGFLQAFGQSTFVLRLLGALTGSLSVIVIFMLGKQLFNHKIGLISAFLLAVSPLHIYHSREARYYGPVILFAILGFYAIARAIESGEKKWWIVYTLSMILLVYTHLLGLLLMVAMGVYVLLMFVFSNDDNEQNRFAWHSLRSSLLFQYLISASATLLAILPILPPVFSWALNGSTFSGDNILYGIDLNMGFFLDLFANFGAGRGLALSLYASVFLFGILGSWQKSWRYLLLLLVTNIIPVAVVYFLQPEHWFSPKYVIFILPLYLIWVGVGIEYLSNLAGEIAGQRKLTLHVQILALSGLLLLFSVAALLKLEDVYFPDIDHWQAYREFLDENLKSGDAIAVLPNTIGTMENDRVLLYFGAFPPGVDVIVAKDFARLSEVANNYVRVWVIADGFTHLDLVDSVAVWMAGRATLPLRFDDRDAIYYLSVSKTLPEILADSEEFIIEYPSFYVSLANVYASVGWMEESLSSLQAAINLDPNNGLWHFRLGEFYFQGGEPAAAEEAFLQAIQLDPQIPGFRAAIADLYKNTGRADLAIIEYQKAIRLWRRQFIGQTDAEFLLTWQAALDDLQTKGP